MTQIETVRGQNATLGDSLPSPILKMSFGVRMRKLGCQNPKTQMASLAKTNQNPDFQTLKMTQIENVCGQYALLGDSLPTPSLTMTFGGRMRQLGCRDPSNQRPAPPPAHPKM